MNTPVPANLIRPVLAQWWPLLLGSAAALVAVQYLQTVLTQASMAALVARLLELWILAGFTTTVHNAQTEAAPGRPWYLRYFRDSGWAFIKLFGWSLALNLIGSVSLAPAASLGPAVGGLLFLLMSGIQYMLMTVFLVCTPDLDFGEAALGAFALIRRAPRWCALLLGVNPGIPLAGGWAVTRLPAVCHAPGAILVALIQQVLGLTLVTILLRIRLSARSQDAAKQAGQSAAPEPKEPTDAP